MGTFSKILAGVMVTAALTGGAVSMVAVSRSSSADHPSSMMGPGPMMNAGSMMGSPMSGMASMMGAPMMGGGWSSSASVPATIEGARAATITAADLRFTPATITATAGEALNVTVRNTDNVVHDFTSPALGLHVVVPAGQSVTFGLRAPSAGTYPFWCSVAGHAQAGMTGLLVVTP